VTANVVVAVAAHSGELANNSAHEARIFLKLNMMSPRRWGTAGTAGGAELVKVFTRIYITGKALNNGRGET
jgi:hypothetical protein